MGRAVFCGALTLGVIAACGGGPGPSADARGGPDGIPSPSTDTPNEGREGPGTPGEPPGYSGQDPEGNCISCDGTYVCTVPQAPSDSPSYITLTSTPGGCGTLDDQGNVSAILQCGGTFYELDNGAVVPFGSWSGGTGHFRVTGTVDGISITVDCLLTNNPPPPTTVVNQPGTGDTVDAG